MYDRVLNTVLEGVLQDGPQEELAIAPVVEKLTTTWQKYHQNKLAVSSTTDIFLKN